MLLIVTSINLQCRCWGKYFSKTSLVKNTLQGNQVKSNLRCCNNFNRGRLLCDHQLSYSSNIIWLIISPIPIQWFLNSRRVGFVGTILATLLTIDLRFVLNQLRPIFQLLKLLAKVWVCFRDTFNKTVLVILSPCWVPFIEKFYLENAVLLVIERQDII